MTSFYSTTALLGLGLAGAIMWLLRRDHLHLKHGLFWLGAAMLAALLGMWPGIIDAVASRTGVNYSPALLLLITVIVLLIKALHADIQNTRIERQVKRLNQRLAMIEVEIEQQTKDVIPR
ncbi:MAG: DUF2304 domain-containing protein [Pseudomonadota bacterium]